MHRLVVLVAFAAVLSLAPRAAARHGGLYFEVAPAWGIYDSSEVIVESGDNGGDAAREPQAGFTPQLKLGVSLFGWAGIEGDAAVFGWNLDGKERGGSGFAGGAVRITPLEVLSYILPDTLLIPSLQGLVPWRDRPFDLGIYVGGGYTIVGQDYAYEGSYLKWGADLKFYVTPNLALGIDFPIRNLFYKPFRYTHYMDGQGFCTNGRKAFGKLGIPVDPNPNRGLFSPLEVNEAEIASTCTERAPIAVFYAPSFTITGVFDFGI